MIKLDDIQLQELTSTSEKRNDVTSIAKAEGQFNPMMYTIPYGFNQTQNVQKPTIGVDYNVLRQFALNYPPARACILRLKTQVSQLEWDISGKDEKAVDEGRIKAVKEKFLMLFEDMNFRRYLDKANEDILTIDALSVYKQRNFGNKLHKLLPVDGATIRIRVDETGMIPDPPETAYSQYIRGKKTADLTKDELLYAVSNPRTNTAYGLSPLESLIITISSALQSQSYNLAYLTEGDDPEGFITMPEDWNEERITKFAQLWDQMIAGNMRTRRRLKFVPAGSTYTPSRKPEDMAFEKFEMWLLENTCSCFGVPPADIGFTQKVIKSTAQVQQITGRERGMRPLINFHKEIFDRVIQRELMETDLQFVWLNVDPTDLKAEAEMNKLLIETGMKSVDQWQIENGYEPIGLSHYIKTSSGIVLVKDILNPKEDTANNPIPKEKKKESEELKRWKRVCLRCIKEDKQFKKFNTDTIPKDIQDDINGKLELAMNPDDVNFIFSKYLNNADFVVDEAVKLYDNLNKLVEGE